MDGMTYQQLLEVVKRAPLLTSAGAVTADTVPAAHEHGICPSSGATEQSPQGEETVLCIVVAPIKENLAGEAQENLAGEAPEKLATSKEAIEEDGEAGDMLLAERETVEGQGKHAVLAMAEAVPRTVLADISAQQVDEHMGIKMERQEEFEYPLEASSVDAKVSFQDRNIFAENKAKGEEEYEAQYPSLDATTQHCQEVDNVPLDVMRIVKAEEEVNSPGVLEGKGNSQVVHSELHEIVRATLSQDTQTNASSLADIAADEQEVQVTPCELLDRSPVPQDAQFIHSQLADIAVEYKKGGQQAFQSELTDKSAVEEQDAQVLQLQLTEVAAQQQDMQDSLSSSGIVAALEAHQSNPSEALQDQDVQVDQLHAGRAELDHGETICLVTTPAETPNLTCLLSTEVSGPAGDDWHVVAGGVDHYQHGSGAAYGQQGDEDPLLQDANCSTYELVVRVLGSPADAPGNAAVFPGEAGVVTHESFHTLCSVCKKEEGPDNTILCDKCDRSFHTECVKMDKLDATHLDEWLCLSCVVEGDTWRWQLTTKAEQVAQQAERVPKQADRVTRLADRAIKQSAVSRKRTLEPMVQKTTTAQKLGGSVSLLEKLDFSERSSTMQLRSRRRQCHYSPTQLPNFDLKDLSTAQSQVQITGCLEDLEDTDYPGNGDPSMEAGEDSKFTGSYLRKREVQALEKLKMYLRSRNRVLEDGWTAHLMKVKMNTALQAYYVSPDRKRFQSKVQVANFLCCKPDTPTTSKQITEDSCREIEDSCKEIYENQSQCDSKQFEAQSKISIPKGRSEATAFEDLRNFVSKLDGTLEDGWQVKLQPKTHAGGRMHISYVSPSNVLLRTRLKVAEYLGLVQARNILNLAPIGSVSSTLREAPRLSADANHPQQHEACEHVDQVDDREIRSTHEACEYVDQVVDREIRSTVSRGDEGTSRHFMVDPLKDIVLAGHETSPCVGQWNECAKTSATEVCHGTQLAELVPLPPVDPTYAKKTVSVGTETDWYLGVPAGYVVACKTTAVGVADPPGGYNLFPSASEGNGDFMASTSSGAAIECSKMAHAIPVTMETVVISSEIETIVETPSAPTDIPGSTEQLQSCWVPRRYNQSNIGMAVSFNPQAGTHNKTVSEGDSAKGLIESKVVGQRFEVPAIEDFTATIKEKGPGSEVHPQSPNTVPSGGKSINISLNINMVLDPALRCPPVSSLAAPYRMGDEEKQQILQKLQAAKRQALLTDMFRPLKMPKALDHPKSDPEKEALDHPKSDPEKEALDHPKSDREKKALDPPRSDPEKEIRPPDMSASRVASAPVVEVESRTSTSPGNAVAVSTSVEQERAQSERADEWRMEPSMKVCFCTHQPLLNKANVPKTDGQQPQAQKTDMAERPELKINSCPPEAEKRKGKKKGAKVVELQQLPELSKGAGKSKKTTSAEGQVQKNRRSKRTRSDDHEEEDEDPNVLTTRNRSRSPEPEQIPRLCKRKRRTENEQDPVLGKRRSRPESDQVTTKAGAEAVEVLKGPEAPGGKRRGRPRKNTVQDTPTEDDLVPSNHIAIPRICEKRRGRPKTAEGELPLGRKSNVQRVLPDPSDNDRRYSELEPQLLARYQVLPSIVKEESLDFTEAEYVHRRPRGDARHQQLETAFALRSSSRGRQPSKSEDLQEIDWAAYMSPERRSSREHGPDIGGDPEYRSTTFSRARKQTGRDQVEDFHASEFHSRYLYGDKAVEGDDEYPGEAAFRLRHGNTEDEGDHVTRYRGRAAHDDHETRTTEFEGKHSKGQRTRDMEEEQQLTRSQVFKHSRRLRGRVEEEEMDVMRAKFRGKLGNHKYAPLAKEGSSSASDAPDMDEQLARRSAEALEQLRTFVEGYGEVLEKGWRAKATMRKRTGCKQMDVTFTSPTGDSFRSKLEVGRQLGLLAGSESRSQQS